MAISAARSTPLPDNTVIQIRVISGEQRLGERVVAGVVVVRERGETYGDSVVRVGDETAHELFEFGLRVLGIVAFHESIRVEHGGRDCKKFGADIHDPAEEKLALLELGSVPCHGVK